MKEKATTVPFTIDLIAESNPELGVMVQYMGNNKCNDTANY